MIFFCFRIKPIRKKKQTKKLQELKNSHSYFEVFFLNVIIPPELTQCWWCCTEMQSSLAESSVIRCHVLCEVSFCWFRVRQVPSIFTSYWLIQKVPPRFKLVNHSYIWMHSLKFPQIYIVLTSLSPLQPPHETEACLLSILPPCAASPLVMLRCSFSCRILGWQSILLSPHASACLWTAVATFLRGGKSDFCDSA